VEYAELFDQLSKLGVLVITFSGGEPFLRRDFLDIVELARKKRFAVRVYTSGTLITPEKADRLSQLKVQEVHISVYSHDADVHNAFTGIPKSHERSVEALRLLNQRGIRTLLKTNIMTFNVDYVDELIELARSVGADYRIDPTVKPKMNGDRSPLAFAVPPDELRKKILWRPDLADALSMEEAEGICDGENPRSGKSGVMCAAGTQLITVNADGTISPCAMFPTNGGDFRKSSVADIWHSSPLFKQVREQRFDDMHDCPSCDVRSSCHPCMAYGLVESGDIKSCNTSSRQYAEGKALLAGRMVQTQRKTKKGRSLPIVGERALPIAFAGVSRLSTEQ
jgi:radical SAM protein with 4Fe4S-binding SPASM domain